MINEKLSDLIQIQHKLANLENNSIASLSKEISTFYGKSDFLETRIIFNILNIVKYRPMKTHLYKNLIQYLFGSDNFAKAIFKSMIFSNSSFSNYEQRTHHVYLAFLFMIDGFFSRDEILNLIECMERTPLFYLFFAWFCPEISESKPELYHSVISHSSIPNDSPNLLKIFYAQLDEYKLDNWKLLKEKRIHCYAKNSLMENIINNQINSKILDLVESDNRIRTSIFEINWILWNYPSYAEFAAYYGSLDCLKFFLDHGVSFCEDFLTLDILSYAIAGGHQNTIEFLEKDMKLNQDLCPNSQFMRVLFYQNFDEKPRKDKFSTIFGSLGQIAASSNNLSILQSLNLSNNTDYLLSSIENGESDGADYLLTKPDILITKEFLTRLVQLDYIHLITQLFQKYKDFFLKQALILNKEQLFISLLSMNKIILMDVSDEIVIMTLLLKEEKAFHELISMFPSKISIKTSENETLLSLAVQNNLISTVKFLLDSGLIDINESDVYFSFTHSMNIFSSIFIGAQFILLFQKIGSKLLNFYLKQEI